MEGLPPLLVWVSLLIVNNYSEFQNIFSNNRDIRKCQSFRTTPDDDNAVDDDARAMTIHRPFFFENRRANNSVVSQWLIHLFNHENIFKTGVV